MRSTAAIALLLLAACVADPGDHLAKAREHAFQRQPAAALAEYEEVLSLLSKKDSRKSRGLLLPALKGAADLCHLDLRQTQKAVEYYRQIASHFPEAREAMEARASLAQIYRSLGERRAAVAELDALAQAFAGEPGVDRYQYQAAKDYFELGDYDQVALEVRSLHKRWPSSSHAADAQLLLAAALYLQGQKDQATEAYLRVAPTSPLFASARFEAAKIVAELGEEERAITLLVEALETHSDPRVVQVEISRLRRRIVEHRERQAVSKGAVWPEWYGAD